jgi:subtilisin family serine protease
VVSHSTADQFVVLESDGTVSASDLADAARKLPGVVDVEPDHVLRLHVIKPSRRGPLPSASASPAAAATDVCPADGACEFTDYKDGSGNETMPYGISMVQGNTTEAGPESMLDSGVAVCVVDSGIWAAHPDLKANTFSGCDTCEGVPWNNPTAFHGTHVAGTIAAVGENQIGVVGVVPSLASGESMPCPQANGGNKCPIWATADPELHLWGFIF